MQFGVVEILPPDVAENDGRVPQAVGEPGREPAGPRITGIQLSKVWDNVVRATLRLHAPSPPATRQTPRRTGPFR